MSKKLYYGMAAFLLLFNSISKAQDTTSSHVGCGMSTDLLKSMGVDSPGHGATAFFTTPDLFENEAKDTCGKFIVFYEDLRPGSIGEGFNAGSGIGVTRRNTMCSVLSYIQSVFDFSNIPSNEYIRLHVDTSWSNPVDSIPYLLGITHWYKSIGYCAPYYDPATATPGAIVNGFVYDYIKSPTGTDPNRDDYHANLHMNFASIGRGINDLARGYSELDVANPIHYYNDTGTAEPCKFDLYSNLLHLVSHSLGWFSWQDTGAVHGVSTTTLPRTYHDTSLCIIDRPKVTSNPFSGISKLLPLSGPWASDKVYLLNGERPPYNLFLPFWTTHPFPPFGIRTEFSHLMAYNFHFNRITPGDFYNPVMGIPIMEGVMSRSYTKGELLHFRDVIGLDLTTSFSSTHSILLNNKLAWSSKMNSDAYNFLTGDQDFAEKINPDYSINNNIGSSVVISLNSDTTLHDDDGDPLSVMPGTLVNFRGCGEGGNNHNRLALSSSDQVITYTPRANFYGRAQFGFNLWDGKEKGAFVIYTIDVKPGSNVGVPIGGNMIVNGNFEEGAEVKLKSTDEGINNSYSVGFHLKSNSFFGGRFNNGTILSDGHPYDALSNYIYGTAVRNSFAECSDATLGKPFGSIANTFPWQPAWLTTSSGGILAGQFGSSISDGNPDSKASSDTNNRYQPLGQDGILFNLTDTLKRCRRYVLEFDTRRTYLTPATSYTASTTYYTPEMVKLHFTNSDLISGLDTTPMIRDVEFTMGTVDDRKWQHFTYSFTYCADTPANVLHLDIKSALATNEHISNTLLDNVSLVEQSLALSIAITDTPSKGCSRTLYAGPPSTGCPGLTYEWRDEADVIVGTSRELPILALDNTYYIVTVRDGCSTAKDTIEITPCPCSPVTILSKPYTTLLTGSVPTTLTPGKYYVPANTVLSGTTDFTDVVMLIEPGVQITVPAAAKLTINNSHLFVCPDTNKLWQGIKLATGAAIEVLNNTLIEDAVVAIDANAPSLTSGSWIINTEGATFNRNRTSISINNYSPSTPVDYPFQIKSTVFTSRHLDTFSGYPSSWPSALSLKTTFPNTSSTPPFEIDRNYLFAKAKDDVPILSAIKLNDVGTLAGGTYPGIQIGSVTDTVDRNLFDNIGDGVLASNSNFTAYNNSFINISVIPPGLRTMGLSYPSGSGINALNGFQRRARVDYINGINIGLSNRFYDCLTGVRISNYSVTNLNRNDFNSSNANPTAILKGIDITATRYDSTIIYGNKMYNIPVGIYFYSRTSLAGYSLGKTQIINNFIQPQLPSPVIASGTEFVKQAIEVSALLMSAASAVTGTMLIKDNELTDVYNGIKLGNNMHQKVYMLSNDVSMKYQNASSIQHGIYCANNTDALVYGNNVSGDGAVATDFKKRAFYNVSNKWHVVDCNTAIHTGRGFDFSGTQPRTYWRGNTMEDNIHGMALGGVIDQQGAPDYAILNEWLGTWSSGAIHQTLCYSFTDPLLSTLFVRNTTTEHPTNNESDPTFADDYNTALAAIVTTPIATDDPCAPSITYEPLGASPSSFIVALKKGGIDYGGTKNAELDWIGQMSLWRMIHASDSFHYHSNNTFVDFANIADTARYGWLTAIEDALGNVDTSTAENLLANPVAAMGTVFIDTTLTITDSSAADYIVDNYVRFYQICLQNSKGQEIDSASLADLCYKCPRLDGEVIHQARALYTQLYGITEVYNDDSLCAEIYPQLRRADPNADTQGLNQEYGLFPNPNNGSFIIQQKEIEDKSVNLKVYNAVGSLVYQSEASFSNGKLKVQMGQQTAGLYLVCIGDAKSKTVCLRFVIK